MYRALFALRMGALPYPDQASLVQVKLTKNGNMLDVSIRKNLFLYHLSHGGTSMKQKSEVLIKPLTNSLYQSFHSPSKLIVRCQHLSLLKNSQV